MKKGKAIHFSVHPTPMKPGDTQQTYHVRHSQDYVMHSRELRELINSYTLISEGMFEMFLDTLHRAQSADGPRSDSGRHLVRARQGDAEPPAGRCAPLRARQGRIRTGSASRRTAEDAGRLLPAARFVHASRRPAPLLPVALQGRPAADRPRQRGVPQILPPKGRHHVGVPQDGYLTKRRFTTNGWRSVSLW